jgi:hypothetical protein
MPEASVISVMARNRSEPLFSSAFHEACSTAAKRTRAMTAGVTMGGSGDRVDFSHPMRCDGEREGDSVSPQIVINNRYILT